MRWCMSHRGDIAAARLADRHYNRQKIGTPQFVPPGSCVVFITDCARAFWVTSGCPVGGMVLDPFGGAGTTGLVADRLGRNSILIELNPDYAAMAKRRIEGDAPLFATVAAARHALDRREDSECREGGCKTVEM